MRSARLTGLVCLALLSTVAGCSRPYWRRNADAEAYGLIREKEKLDARWSQPRSDVIPSPLSRNFDPADPDYGPLPPDDPAANAYMRRMSDCNRIRGSLYWDKIGMGNTIENPAWVASLPPELAPPEPLPGDKAELMEKPSAIADLAEHGITKPLRSILARFESATPGRASVATADVPAPRAGTKPSTTVAKASPPAASPERPAKPQSDIQLASFQEEPANEDPPALPPADDPLGDRPLPPAPLPPGDDDPQSIPSPDGPPAATLPDPDEALSEDPGNPDTAATAPSKEVDFTAGNPALPPIENLTLEEAVRLSYLHNRDYQTQIEDVFLAALDLAFDRFQFDVRFLGIGRQRPSSDLTYTGVPEGQQSLAFNNRIGISRLLPAGGQWVVELANQTLWLFSDAPDESTTASTLSFSFVQPLLFAAGRKIVLEDLTQSERNLLYAARDLARFRQTFFVATVSGQQGGYLALIEQIQTIANQEDNLRRLKEQLDISKANILTADALSITNLESQYLQQVNQLRSSRVQLQDRLDSYKFQLGLPPDTRITLDTKLLQPFRLISPELAALEESIDDEYFAVAGGILLANPQAADLRRSLDVLRSLAGRIRETAFPIVAQDFERVEKALPKRLANLPDPEEDRKRILDDNARDKQLSEEALRQFNELEGRIELLSGWLRSVEAPEGPPEFSDLDKDADGKLTREEMQAASDNELFARLSDRADELDRNDDGGVDRDEFGIGVRQEVYLDAQEIEEALERGVRGMQGIQAGLRTELIELNPFALPLVEAVGYGLTNRVDLMNQRALVMDARRKVEVASNALRAVLDVRVEGDVRTRPLFQNDNPLDLRRKNSTYRVGIGFVAPLDQIAQRNSYRVSQVTYQRARRSYIQAEDQVKQQVRQNWRQIELLKQNFEIARYAIRVAAKQYDLAVEQATGPQRGGGGGTTGGGSSGGGAGNQGTQLSTALNRLLQAQNQLIGIWVDYESARLNIYRDMGIMEIDARGLWCDPYYQNGLTWPEGAVGTLPGQGGASEGADGGSAEKPGPEMIPPAPPPPDGVEMGGTGPAVRNPTSTPTAFRPASPAGRGVRPAAANSPPTVPAHQVSHDRTRPSTVRNQPKPADGARSVPAGDGAVSGGAREGAKAWRPARKAAAAAR